MTQRIRTIKVSVFIQVLGRAAIKNHLSWDSASTGAPAQVPASEETQKDTWLFWNVPIYLDL